MKTIRCGTFETNSSSCHSITFNNDGENVQGDIKSLRAEAENYYCGSHNYQYDYEDGYRYSYDAGAPIGNPQGKFEYALICYIEQLNTIANDKKCEWYDKHPDECNKYDNIRWGAPLLDEIYDELVEDYNNTKNLIIDVFKNEYGIDVKWNIPEPLSLEEVNSGRFADGTSCVRDLIEVNGCIDHESSCTEHTEDAWELADMVRDPYQLYNWVFIDTNDVILCRNG